MQIVPLFPTPAGLFDLDRDFTESERSFIKNSKFCANAGNYTSIDNYILKNRELDGLYNFCLKSATLFYQEMYKPPKEIQLYITQSWLNCTKMGGHHHKHYHLNSIVSGVLFIQADKQYDTITFLKEQNNQIDISPTEFHEFNSSSWWLEAHSSRLIIFPSHLHHMVDPIKTKQRISLSFNTFIRGNLGSNTQLTELVL